MIEAFEDDFEPVNTHEFIKELERRPARMTSPAQGDDVALKYLCEAMREGWDADIVLKELIRILSHPLPKGAAVDAETVRAVIAATYSTYVGGIPPHLWNDKDYESVVSEIARKSAALGKGK